MKRLFIWLVLIVLIVGGFIVALPSLFSSDQIWAKVSPILEQQVGRKIAVSGTRKLSLYPDIALILGDVEIGSNVSDDTPLASLQELRVSVDLMSLFSGKINVKELSLIGADISLIVDQNGVANWQTSNDAPAPLPEQANNPDDPLGALIADSVNETSQPTSDNGVVSEFSLADLSIKNFKISNSRLTYENQQAGTFELAENINIDIGLAAQNEQLSLVGNATWQKQAIDFNLNGFNIADFLADQPAALAFKMSSTPLNFDLGGQIQNGEKLKFDGKIALSTNSLKQTANWLKTDLSSVNDSAINLNTNLKISGSNYQLAGLSLSAFGSKINGTLNLSLAGLPNIYGKLAIDRLNYGQIIPASGASSGSSSWSNAAFSAGILSQINSNIELTIGDLNYDGITADNIATTLIIRKQAAKIPFQMNVFGGQVAGTINAQLAGKAVNLAAAVQVDGIKAGDALTTLDITDKLTATTYLNTQITTSGASVAQLMAGLNGTGTLEMRDGVISGIALADALAPQIANIDLSLNSPEKLAAFALDAGKNLFDQNVSGLLTDGFANGTGAEKQTKFVKAVMNFTIAGGILDNQDLEITSENIVIRGAGQVDLGGRQINYRVIPKVIKQADANGQGYERMTVPVLITGPWSDPNIAVDYAYAIENSSTINNMRTKLINKVTDKITEKVTEKIIEKVTEKITETIGQELGDKVGEELSKQVGDQIGNLLGLPKTNNEQAGALPEEAPKSDAEKLLDAGNLLNNLFNAPK